MTIVTVECRNNIEIFFLSVLATPIKPYPLLKVSYVKPSVIIFSCFLWTMPTAWNYGTSKMTSLITGQHKSQRRWKWKRFFEEFIFPFNMMIICLAWMWLKVIRNKTYFFLPLGFFVSLGAALAFNGPLATF